MPSRTRPSCSCGWLWSGTVAPGSNRIRFSIARSPNSGRPVTPAASSKARVASNRMNCGSRSIVHLARLSFTAVTVVELPLLRRQAYVDGRWGTPTPDRRFR